MPDTAGQFTLEVTVTGTGRRADQIGWPGTSDTYRLDIRVPDGQRLDAALQVTAAFVQGASEDTVQ